MLALLALGCGDPAASSSGGDAVAASPEAKAEPTPPAAAGDDGSSSGAGTSATTDASGDGSGDEPEPPPPEPEPDPLHGEVRPGDSLSKILHRAGLGGPEIHQVAEALAPVMDPATIRIGQRYDVELDEGGELLSFAFRISVTELARVRRQDDGSLIGELDELPTTRREEEIVGEVSSSLWAALTDRGHSPALVDVIVDVFAYDIDFFTSTREGDRFALVVERHELDGELVRYGRVLAAEYRGEAAGEVRVLWWEPSDGGEGRYVDDDGQGVSRTVVKSPLKYARISSGFDPKRMHPVLHRVKSHQGVDYAAPEGTPVWAAADGTIVFRAEKGGAGNMVILRHPGGLKTLYMHLSRFAEGQKVGDAVAAKTVIGYVGMTGLATGPHLHFGMQKNGRYVDPTSIESVRGPGVAKADRKRFAKVHDRWVERLAGLGEGETGEVEVPGDDAVAPSGEAGDEGIDAADDEPVAVDERGAG
ncbi:MAG: peptidoglycan DD-metalloendopeptidase family protein [Myxococcales bacterium]|nr:peptidoglycan DD-metalloendopeptidase family protein [Myxococcales bacterium]